MMKLSRNAPGVPYSTRVAVLVQELVKLLICSLLYAAEVGGPLSLVRSIRRDVRDNAVEWMQLGIPAALYTIQNNALFVGLSNLDAAVAHVTYQTKILFTALFSIVLMHRRLGPAQWCGIACLLMGVISVQGILDDLLRMLLVTDYSNAPAHTKSMNATLDTGPVAVRRRRDGHPRLHEAMGGRLLAADGSSAAAVASTRLLGVGAVLTAAICTSFASVYFERMLKSERKPSLWLRNIQVNPPDLVGRSHVPLHIALIETALGTLGCALVLMPLGQARNLHARTYGWFLWTPHALTSPPCLA
eukprot:scaffold219726_cov40-Tisochrysis_lutea.AAC.1